MQRTVDTGHEEKVHRTAELCDKLYDLSELLDLRITK